jgi:exosortase
MRSKVLPAGFSQTARVIAIFAIGLSSLLLFWPSLKTALGLALRDDRYLQIVLAPLMSSFLVFWQRTEIFSQARYSPRVGIPLLSVAVLLGLASAFHEPGSESAGLLLEILAMVLIWMAGFVLCYGVQSFWAALYPLCCLFLMLPLPPSWMDRINTVFQYGSAEGSYRLLRLSGIPVLRHGVQFSLPGLNFEIAPECSGIRSSLALLMVAIVAGYVYLRSPWARLALIFLTVPIVILKNAVRIAVISALGAYVDRAFVDGPFHHQYGGLLFSLLGVALFVLALTILQKVERQRLVLKLWGFLRSART